MTARIPILLICLFFCQISSAVELEISPETSNTGTFTLHWQGDEGQSFELMELSADGDTRLVYHGNDTARVMTGLPNGLYTYRVRVDDNSSLGPWSAPSSVTVAHHSLIRAFSFFGIGLLVFLATVTIILRGERNA
jgi:hypothetical protein